MISALGAILLAGQEGPGLLPAEAVEEIVVTGERVSRTVHDTPSSVVVFTAPVIEAAAGADRLDQLLELVPNIQLGSGGQGPTIRGQDSTGVLQDLPAFLGGTRPRVTQQIDGRAVSFNEFVNGVAPLWDVERIEVFRSPQSTTQGRNAIAGGIFVHTNDPTFEWEARARLIHGNLDTWQGSAVISGPLVDNQLAFRLAGDARTSRTANRTLVNVVGANPNRDRYASARAKLLAEPAELPGLRLELTYVHQDSRHSPAEGINPPFEKRRRSVGTAVFDSNVDSLTSELSYQVSKALDVTLTSSTGWVEVRRFAPPGLGVTQTTIRDQSIETLVNWRPGNGFAGRAGFHRLRTKLDQAIDLSRVFGIGEFIDRQDSLGLFGELEVKPVPSLTVIAGLRRQHDRQNRDGTLGSAQFPTRVDFDRSFDAWLPKLSIAYDISDKLTAGILVQRAYNPGGTTINFDLGQEQLFEQESLWSYELFGRARLFANRLNLSANLFRYDFRNAQRAEPRIFIAPGSGVATWALISNVPEARSRGLEIEADWRASERLHVRGGVGLLETKIEGSASGSFASKEFARAPRFSGSAAVQWQPVTGLQLNVDLRHNSGYFSDDLNTPQFAIKGTTVVNARAAYRLGSATLSAYARNLFDRFYLTYQLSPSFATAGEPREVGASLDVRF